MSQAGNGASNTPIFVGPNEKPKDLFGAISNLEIIYEAERSGTQLPEKFATLKDRIDFFNLGMRSILGGTFISILLAPLSSAVIGERLPIFGSFNPSVTDKILAYVLSFGYTIAYMMLFIYAARLRRSAISRIISSNLIVGMTFGAILKFFIATFIYGLTYFVILTQEHLIYLFKMLIKLGIPENVYEFLRFIVTAFRESLIPAIYIFFFTTAALVLIPWAAVIYTKIKNKPKEL